MGSFPILGQVILDTISNRGISTFNLFSVDTMVDILKMQLFLQLHLKWFLLHHQFSQNIPKCSCPATESVNLNDNVKIIPEKMSNYVPFGHFKDVKNIIKSKIFFPVFITGLSGNGKTLDD